MSETATPPAPETAAPTPAPAPTPAARIVSDKPRSRVVPLEWPVEFDGRLYESITIRRMSAREVADFVESLKGRPDRDTARWPMFDVPDAVLDALDDDDDITLNAAVVDFLPRRFRAAPAST